MVEESGVKWRMEHFYEGALMSNPKPSNPKPRYPDMGRIIYLDIWFVKPLNTAPKM